ncbi:uncharacterized protein CTRU02_206254 [Colletotrichum truncatum]|uniref:Uncharacterized protein n=1 Tax=Colletotrichum truncatum TaxID=5467 RepID=A0ACC3Z6A8_COLTU|nr:uncharacterized protein CTRU02_09907 [Colletotrichum truncatum]KAF6788094.1 hypothetical protein CTRU02_09907 [Colletotrichum truncatum]
MPRRLRTSTPGMMLGPLGGGPNSPPQSPTSTSPMLNHKQYAARHLPPYHNINRPVLLDDSGIQPTGNGHHFSFTPSNRFAQLSPRTSSDDSDEEEESESESESDESEAPRTKPMPADEDEDSDEEDDSEEESIDEEEESDEDGDISMNIYPPAPAPVPMPAPMPVSMPPPISAPLHTPRMAVDSSSEEESNDEDEEDDDDDDDDEEDDDSEEEEQEEASDSDSDSEILPHAPELPQEPRPAAVAPKANFTVEEMSDFDPMDHDRTGTIAPSGFSSPASARSRSRAPAAAAAAPAELPPGFTQDMRNLNCSASDSESDSDSSEDVDEDAAAHREFVRMQRELRMRKRRTHGSSIGKRTISERSDSDHEDWTPIDPDAVGSSARRLRRRVGDRRSFIHLQFQDPPPPRIDECDEPESEVEGAVYFCDGETLARELPYWSIEIMEYESPSP